MNKKVLILEPHPYHQEILPGFVKYFQDLNYECDVYVQESQKDSEVFCRFSKKPNIVFFTPDSIKATLKNVSEYDFIFFSSLEYFHTIKEKYTDFLGYEPKTKFGILAAYHTLSFIDQFNSQDLYNQGRIFTLAGFNYKDEPTQMLAPVYFGDNVKRKRELNKKIRFISVGYRSSNLLFEVVDKLKAHGYKNFEIIIIGSGKLKYKCRNKIVSMVKRYFYKKHIKHLGKLNFADMFDYLENADFYMPLMDISDEGHHHYLKTVTSGSRQLILGFLKPCLINEKFGKVYDFDDSNAILYKENDLFDAMQKALELSQEEYSKKQDALQQLSDAVYQKSLGNLKVAIERSNVKEQLLK